MSKTRIEYNMPAHEYHAIDAVSKSMLGKFGKTAAHGRYALDNPKDTDALRFGRAFHVLSLEPEKFEAECAVAPDCEKRSNADKQRHADFAAANKGKTIITAKEHDRALAMAESFRTSPQFRALGANLKYEVSIFWVDEETGEECKTRLDAVDEERGIIYDLKSVRDASEDGFARDAFAYDYPMGAAIHYEAFQLAYGRPAKMYIMPLVENDEPHLTRPVSISPDSEIIAYGHYEYRRRIERYSAAKKAKRWDGYNHNLQELQVPSWIQRKWEQIQQNGEM
jgi:hypothetical protein